MTGFDTPFSFPFLGLWLVAGGAGLLWMMHGFRGVVGRRYAALLGTLRAAAAALLLILLLQPYRRVDTPDRDAFWVALLADCSHSMTVRDCDGRTARIERVQAVFEEGTNGALRGRLAETYRLSTFLFSEELHVPHHVAAATEASGSREGSPEPAAATSDGAPFDVLPGKSALGDALRQCLDEFSTVPLGGVIVLSDGHENHGEPVAEVCKVYRGRGIPVSCVGVGEFGEVGDLRISFPRDTVEAVKGEPVTVEAVIENTMRRDVVAGVSLTGDAETQTKEVEVQAGGSAKVTFTTVPWRAGFQTLRAELTPTSGDARRDNDVDFVGVDVTEPDVFRLLYLGAYLGWEYKFLKLLADSNEQLSLACVIRAAKASYYTHGLPERDSGKGYPREQRLYNQFDAVLVDTRAFALCDQETVNGLLAFVEHRGGGVLFFGPLSGIPEAVADALPIARSEFLPAGKPLRFAVNPNFLFEVLPGDVLDRPTGLEIERGSLLSFVGETKRGARPAAVAKGSERPVVIAQSYGSGRVAFVAFESSWRWRLSSSTGHDQHDAFWGQLLGWLGSTSKERVAPACDGVKSTVGDELALDVEVLGTDFRPSADARVSCDVTSPDGATQTVVLDPSAAAVGRYTGLIFPDQPGEYMVDYRVDFPGDRPTPRKAHFVARQTGRETEDTRYREETLRDMARITGGRFWTYKQLDSIRELPLSPRLPATSSRLYLCDSWLLFVLLAVCLAGEWYARRRIGLK